MKVIAAVDASAASEDVLSEIAIRRWPDGTRFEVLTIADTGQLSMGEAVVEELQVTAREVAQRAADRLAAAGFQAIARTQWGDPKTAILDYAADGVADWIVIGAHTSLIDGFLLGSVAKALIRQAPCPVEIVRRSEWRKDKDPGKRILLATDGSEASELAARSIASRPWSKGTQVRVFSAVELSISTLQAFEPPMVHSQAVEEMRVQALLSAEAAIGRAREILESADVTVSEALSVLFEKPAKVIIDEARDWGTDMIVVGSHGRRGWSRLWLGSVCEAVAMHAKCCVEVVRQTPSPA